MFDLHCHILAGIDDGAKDLDVSLDMARQFVEQGVEVVACTPLILPGVYHNSGPAIRLAVAELQTAIDEAGIPLRLVPGADNHIVPNFVQGIARGHLLTLGDTRYVLVEPPHHVAPLRMDDLFFSILVAGYVPILTHPERLTWIDGKYDLIQTLAARGVLMQITSGSLTGRFGRQPRYWAERMLDDGLVHLLATDAHDTRKRPPDLARGYDAAAQRIGAIEATHLCKTRPGGILANVLPSELPPVEKSSARPVDLSNFAPSTSNASDEASRGEPSHGLAGRLRQFFFR